MGRSRFRVEQQGVTIRCQPELDAEEVSTLELGDELVAPEVIILHGIEWLKLPQGSTATRVNANGKTLEVPLNLPCEGYVPTLDPVRGTLLKKHGQTQVVVQEKHEEGALSKTEIAEILGQSSDPNLMLPLESKYWTKQQLQMFVLSGGSIRPSWCSIPDERLMANTNMTVEEVGEALTQAADWIANADAILIGSGAGMGVDSGLGTFRGSHMGVWEGLQAVGLAYEEICQPRWFQEEPHLGWAFWNFCHEAYQATAPHSGYTRVREWGLRCPLGFFSFTSNIDSHWVASGTSSERVLEVHGAVKWLQCSKPCSPDVWKAPKDLRLEEDRATHRVQGILPTCPKCRAVARPNVQMFGGDSGFSKARRATQFGRYDAWLKQLEARPDKDSLRVTCVELGCGLTVPTVRNELESVVKKFPNARLVRVNPENPGIATGLADKGVSLPLKAGAAIEELHKQVVQEQSYVTFLIWGRGGGGCEIRAPYNTTLGRLLRLCEREEGVSVHFHNGAKGYIVGADELVIGPDQAVEPKCFAELKAGEGEQMLTAAIIDAEAAFLDDKGDHTFNSVLSQRMDNVNSLLLDMNALFAAPAYQDKVRACSSRKEFMEQLKSVQFAVLPKYGIEASDRGTRQIMSHFIGTCSKQPHIQAEINRSMELSRHELMNQLPVVASRQRKPEPEPLQVTCMPMRTEEGAEDDKVQLEATTHTPVWELRDKLANLLSWDEETTRKVAFFAQQGRTKVHLEEGATVCRTVYLQNCPPLREAAPVEVTFKEMNSEEGQAPQTFVMTVMSDQKISELRCAVGEALGWTPAERKAVKFLIRMGNESFGVLKDREKVQARKVIFVHGASLVPPAGQQPPQDTEESGTGPGAETAEDGEDLEIDLVLDPENDAWHMPYRCPPGTTIGSIKQQLVDSDPTERLRPETFWLGPDVREKQVFHDHHALHKSCRLEVTLEEPEWHKPRPPPPEERAYFVSGSWLNYKPTPMTREGACYVHTLKMDKSFATFQILLEGKWDLTFYPSIKDARPGKDYELRGPDSRGHGYDWMIGAKQGQGVAKPGSRFKIIVSVDNQHLATKVTWRQVPS